MLQTRRKSVEPLVMHRESDRLSALRRSMHHFVSKSKWSDVTLLEQVRRWVLPRMNPANGMYQARAVCSPANSAA
jgi:SRSO17 transposase